MIILYFIYLRLNRFLIAFIMFGRETTANYRKINVIITYLEAKREIDCCIKKTLKEELENAFEEGLLLMNKKAKKRSLPARLPELIFRRSSDTTSTNTERAISPETINDMHMEIVWTGDEDTAHVTISFDGTDSAFHKSWFEKSMLEFCRGQMMVTHHLI